MDEQVPKPKSKIRLTAYVIAGLAVAGLVAMAVLGGYTPLYRAFFQAPKQPHFAEHVPGIEGIEYAARINQGLYRGADPQVRLDQLKKLGIRTIINFRYLKTHDYQAEAEASGFKYFWIPIYPGEPPPEEDIQRFLEIVNNPANQPVYIHCTLGIDRTGLMAGIYRIEHDGWSNEMAVAEMEYFGHNELWIDLEEHLKGYKR